MALTYLCPADADSLQPVPVLDANKMVRGITQETAFQACKAYSAVFNTTPLGCGVDRATSIIVDFIVALALLYFVVTYILLALKLKGYRKQPYAFVQVGLVYNTLQVLLAPELLLPPSIARLEVHSRCNACHANCCCNCSQQARERERFYHMHITCTSHHISHTPCIVTETAMSRHRPGLRSSSCQASL